nr:SIR2 family protein [uncultured Blautia sp.]
MDYIREIAEAMSANHAAVMIGAGFSKNADKISATDKWFKNWNELSDMFYDTVYGNGGPGKEYNSSLRLAQEVEVTVGRPKLERILKDAVPDEDYGPSEVYIKLMELPWRDVFTTNYDTLLERAADKVSKRRYNVVVNQEDLVNSNDAPRILKLHGSFPSQRPFIITEEDYRTYPIKFAAMVNTVQQALLENVFCMIGFSCEDPNFLSWIGWIYDNLGKSSSQKIYMISVSHISEAKQKLLFDKNIIVVDLEKLYPEKEIEKRLMIFFQRLSDLAEEKRKKNQWFDLSEIALSAENGFEEKAKKLKILNESYPGWVFLPWKMKYAVNHILEELNEDENFFRETEKLEEISFNVQVEYIYEYVKFFNIVGRPIILQTAKKFLHILEKVECHEEKTEYKVQYIYLQLMRAFRELADWEKYDLCREQVQDTILKYEEKQFLYANDWWMTMYRFKDANLIDLLNKWDLTQGDLYWPMIKSCMYALVGEIAKGEQILSEILPRIRHQLVKNSRDEYLCSMEESVVSLLNFIKQGNLPVNGDMELERCIQVEDISWWKENEEYCSHLNEKENIKPEMAVHTNYDLSVTYTSYMGRDDKKTYYALDYLRFLEQTGHPFRIQIVTNTKGFQAVIEKLYLYYPHWCLMQMIIAQNDKELDVLFGRNKLSGMTQLEVDECIREYLNALKLVSKNIKPENAYWAESVYDNSAKILPQIISRLCYKCSLDILDQVLDYMLILCSSNVRDNFTGINKILEGVCSAYTEKEQESRIEKILRFPMRTSERQTYYDPVNYLKRPKEKYKINDDLYCNTMIQIRQLIEHGSEQENADALQRLIILAQLVYLQKNDEEYLYQCLEVKKDYKYKNILYHINKERYKLNYRVILKCIIQLMEKDSNEQVFSGHAGSYREFIDILPDLQSNDIDYRGLFLVMAKLVKSNIHWKRKRYMSFQIEERSKQSYRIAVGLLLLKRKEQKEITFKEEEAIDEYFKILQIYYSNSSIPELIKQILIVKPENDFKKFNEKIGIYPEMEEKLWLHSEEDIKLLQIFYSESDRMKYAIKKDERLRVFSNLVYQIDVYKIINAGIYNIMPALQLLYALVVNEITTKKETKRLFINLPKLMEDTTIKIDDFENEARYKLNCRSEICEITSVFYKKGVRNKNVLEWMKLTKSSDEFVEIRNVEFE